VKNVLQPLTHLPPQALEFESTVLGAAMLEAYAAHVLEQLTEQSFYQREHQLIFAAIRDLVA
jgi:replicative DNA helicase